MKVIFTYLFFGLVLFSVTAQTSFDREKWKELKEDLHYKKSPMGEEEYFEEWSKQMEEGRSKDESNGLPKRNYLDEKERNPKPMKRQGSLEIPAWIIYLLYIVAAGALLFVIYKIFFEKIKQKNKFIPPVVEEDIPIEKPFDELELLLQKYLQEGNFREAVRIQFIFIIKILREKKWISWEKKKTNTAYLFEMRNRKEFNSFSQATLLFEMIWYGKREINSDQYQQLRPYFDALLNSIRQSHE